MQIIAALTGLLSIAGLLGSLTGSFAGLPPYVAVAGLLLAAAVFLARGVGPFLRFFVVFYGLGYIGLVLLLFAQPLLPAAWVAFAPPPLTAFTAAAFGLLAFGMGRVPVMRQITAITDPYFTTNERATFNMGFGPTFTFFR